MLFVCLILAKLYVANGLNGDRLEIVVAPDGSIAQNAVAVEQEAGGSGMVRRDDSATADTPSTATATPTTNSTPVRAEIAGHTASAHPDNLWAGQYDGASPYKEEVAMAKAVAWILIGSIFTVISLVYLVNFPSKTVQVASWRTISNSISLFCAVLFFKAIKATVMLAKGSAKLAPDASTLTAYFLVFLIFFVVVECFLLLLKKKPTNLAAWGLIGAHLVGFMAAYAFGTLQMHEPFSTGAGYSFMVIPIALLVIGSMCGLSGMIRNLIVSSDNVVDQYEAAWLKQCIHTEDEIIGFALGLVITQTVRFMILGRIPYFSGPQVEDDSKHIWSLFCMAIFFGLVMLVTDQVRRYLIASEAGATYLRISHTCTQIFAMTVGWCLLFWGKYFFWYATGIDGPVSEGRVLICQMEMALGFSLVSFAVIILCDYSAQRFVGSKDMLESVSEAFEFVVALSWECLFMTALSEAMYADYPDKVQRFAKSTKICVTLCFFILPAWVLYILPKALAGANHGHADAEKADVGLEDAAPEGKENAKPDGETTQDIVVEAKAEKTEAKA